MVTYQAPQITYWRIIITPRRVRRKVCIGLKPTARDYTHSGPSSATPVAYTGGEGVPRAQLRCRRMAPVHRDRDAGGAQPGHRRGARADPALPGHGGRCGGAVGAPGVCRLAPGAGHRTGPVPVQAEGPARGPVRGD